MNGLKLPLLLLAVSYLAFVLGLVLTLPRLPEQVASHFNAAGNADGWMSRGTHTWLMGAVGIGSSLFLLVLFYCVRFFPAGTINLPRREYWLAPERRARTYRILLGFGIWLAAVEVLFLFALHMMLVGANASEPPRLSQAVWVLVGGFVAIVAVWTTLLVRRFRR